MSQLQNLPQTGPPLTVADEIEKLARLREAGVLTEEEFATHKARLLGGASSWQYLCIDLDLTNEADRVKLAELGEAGWELVQFKLGNAAAHASKAGMTLLGGQEGDWVFIKPDVSSPDQVGERGALQRRREVTLQRLAHHADPSSPTGYQIAQVSARPLRGGVADLQRTIQPWPMVVLVTLSPGPPEHELWWWMERVSAVCGHRVLGRPYDSLAGTFSIQVSAEELESAIRDLRVGVEDVSASYPEAYFSEQERVNELRAAEERDRLHAQQALQVVVDRVMNEPLAEAQRTSKLQRLEHIAGLVDEFGESLASGGRHPPIMQKFDKDIRESLNRIDADLPRCEEAASKASVTSGWQADREHREELVEVLEEAVAEALTEITSAVAEYREEVGLPSSEPRPPRTPQMRRKPYDHAGTPEDSRNAQEGSCHKCGEPVIKVHGDWGWVWRHVGESE